MFEIKDVEHFRKHVVQMLNAGEIDVYDALENLRLSNLDEVEAYELLGLDVGLNTSLTPVLDRQACPYICSDFCASGATGPEPVPVKTA